MALRAFISGAGCLAFLMSKYVLFKETNKAKTSILLDFVCFKYKQKERGDVVISAATISNASYSIAPGVPMVFVTVVPTGLVPTIIW